MGSKLEQTIAILNGVAGDYLARNNNGLATTMTFVHGGHPLPLDVASLRAAHETLRGRVVVLAHGLMCTEDVWRFPTGEDYGALLARDFGFTPFYLRYNTGLPFADNGAALADLLSRLVAIYPEPIEEIWLLGYSMGGLVIRSACHFGELGAMPWIPFVRRAIYVGTPHLGAPGERAGKWVSKLLRLIDDPYTRAIGELAELRSAGIKDLGDPRHPAPLLEKIDHRLIASRVWDLPWIATWFGDSIVPQHSALNALEHTTKNVRLLNGLNHVDLAHDAQVYGTIKRWCEEETWLT